MDEGLVERLSELAPDVDVEAARVGFDRRRNKRERRSRAVLGVVAVAALVAAGVIVRTITDDPGDVIVTTDGTGTPARSEMPSPSTVTAPVAQPGSTPTTVFSPSSSVTATPTSSTPAPMQSAMIVTPFGVSSEATGIRISENEIDTQIAGTAGEIVLTYELELGIFPLPNPVKLVAPTQTDDGQLAVEVDCPTPECLIEPLNDEFQITIQIAVRTTDRPLTSGIHSAAFTLEFSNDSTTEFDVQFSAQTPPSEDVAELVASSTGAPAIVQRVFGVGRFAYYAISAFDSIWIVGQLSNTVARIDALTGQVLATISLGPPGPPGGHRLAAGIDAVYVDSAPVVRIDPANNTVTPIDGGIDALAVTADGDTAWAAGRAGIQRIDPDGTITTIDVPDASWFDLAYTTNTVWALSQSRGSSMLLAFDRDTGAIRHQEALALADDEVAVRLVAVADDDQIIIGTDTSGGGGRTGRVIIYDAQNAQPLGSVTLDSRPEGIVVTENYIWTSAAIIERTSLTVEIDNADFGFTITQGPDGSIWGTTGIPSSATAEGVANRWAPGNYAN